MAKFTITASGGIAQPTMAAVFKAKKQIQMLKVWAWVGLSCLMMGWGTPLFSHPMPNSLLELTVQAKGIWAEVRMPAAELQMALQDTSFDLNTLNIKDLSEDVKRKIKSYLQAHIRPKTLNGAAWQVSLEAVELHEAQDQIVGSYREVFAKVWMQAPTGADIRNLRLEYDAIMHYVINHAAFISVRQDWQNGLHGEQATQLGAIQLDIPSGKIPPFDIALAQGSWWKGFKSMFTMGMHHISEGTDHLLFLLVLLIPAVLLVEERRWGRHGGLGYSLKRLAKIVTAFTAGHSLTLLIGAMGGQTGLSSQWVEVAIAFSILISAIHACYPLFNGKEILIAAGFGLIHGLAFAQSLQPMIYDPMQGLLSILGFNLGIEFMQLGIVILVMPWLFLLSQTNFYGYFRLGGAGLAGVAALGWMLERVQGASNFISEGVTWLASGAFYGLAVLALLSVFLYRHYNWKVI